MSLILNIIILNSYRNVAGAISKRVRFYTLFTGPIFNNKIKLKEKFYPLYLSLIKLFYSYEIFKQFIV